MFFISGLFHKMCSFFIALQCYQHNFYSCNMHCLIGNLTKLVIIKRFWHSLFLKEIIIHVYRATCKLLTRDNILSILFILKRIFILIHALYGIIKRTLLSCWKRGGQTKYFEKQGQGMRNNFFLLMAIYLKKWCSILYF